MKNIRKAIKKHFIFINPFRKGKKLNNTLKINRLKCQEGSLFLFMNLYNLKMRNPCPNFKENFVRESRFYWGVITVSHAFTTIFSVMIYFIVHTLCGWDITTNVLAIVLIFNLLLPLTFRFSVEVWIKILI
jgi:hypothetical protein